MPLVLGFHPEEKFYVGDIPVTVKWFEGHKRAGVEVKGRHFTITDEEATEILPKVFVTMGNPRPDRFNKEESISRIAIDAPRSITILRQELYEQAHAR